MPLRAPRGLIAEDDPKVAPIGHPAPPWLINYADLMTEMVAFFVIRYSLGAALNKNLTSSKRAVEQLMQEEKISGQVEFSRDGMKDIMQETGNKNDSNACFES